MGEHEKVGPKRATKPEEVARYKNTVKPQSEGTSPLFDFPAVPSIAAHAAILRRVESDEQRANMVAQLQQSYGNAYVQKVIDRIQGERGSGQPLEPGVRSRMEAAFGEDFEDVRVHTDDEASRLAHELGAEAFTTGKDVFFRGGTYQPESEAGKRLLGHELAHVVQQPESLPNPTRVTSPAEPAEVEADAVASALASDLAVQALPQAGLGGALARTPGDSDQGTITIGPVAPSTYNVSGNTLAEVQANLDPLEWGRCTWSWSQSHRSTEGTIDRVNVTLGLRIRMPQWTGQGWNRASEAAKAEWNRMVGCLQTHEDEHAQRAQDWAPQLQQKLLGQPESEANTLWEQGKADHQGEQDTYDADTSHGETQGVSLDTSIDAPAEGTEATGEAAEGEGTEEGGESGEE